MNSTSEKLLTQLLSLQKNLDQLGGIEKNGILFEEYLMLRAKILSVFGLPDSNEYATIFSPKKETVEKSVQSIIEMLHLTAHAYLSSTPETEQAILEKALLNSSKAEHILPILGISTHLYTIYVYNEVFLKKKDNPAAVLEALKLADSPKTLNILGILALSDNFGEEEKTMLEYLNRVGIKYLSDYIGAYRIENKKEELVLSQLAEFWNDLHGGYEFESMDKKFDSLCYYLMNYLCLLVGTQSYRFTELEIYYFDEKNHPDPYTHKDKLQLQPGNFYFNGFGIDITFGNPDKEIYGGILIRGLKNLNSGKFINGPSNVLKEIFNSFGNILEAKNSICIRELNKGVVEETEPLKTTRIGLTKKADDNDDYFDRPYRYLVELCLEHKFKDKEKVIGSLKLDDNESFKIMGYKLK
jgi:hypothetical protein